MITAAHAQASSRRHESAQTAPSAQEPANEFATWSQWLTQATEAGSTLAELFALEVRLAVADAGRLWLLMLMAIPIMVFTWLSFAVLIAWWVAYYSASVGWGIGTFLGLQLAALFTLIFLWQRYKRSLKLPLTRQYLKAFMGGLTGNEAHTTDSQNPRA